MPQLNINNYLSQSTWLIIIFIIYHIIMKSVYIPAIYEYYFITKHSSSSIHFSNLKYFTSY